MNKTISSPTEHFEECLDKCLEKPSVNKTDDCRAAFARDCEGKIPFDSAIGGVYQQGWNASRADLPELEDMEAVVVAYNHAKANGLPLTAIQPNIDIISEFIANSRKHRGKP